MLTGAAAAQPGVATQLAAQGCTVVLIGDSPAAQAAGIKPSTSPPVTVRAVVDEHNPKLPIVWEQPLELTPADLPPTARVRARERWSNTPLIATIPLAPGAIVWIAAPPGPKGYERFPYLPQTLAQAGASAPFQSRHLWAFFDSSYRLRADPDYLAERWRRSGIAALHIAAWHMTFRCSRRLPP